MKVVEKVNRHLYDPDNIGPIFNTSKKLFLFFLPFSSLILTQPTAILRRVWTQFKTKEIKLKNKHPLRNLSQNVLKQGMRTPTPLMVKHRYKTAHPDVLLENSKEIQFHLISSSLSLE